MKYFQKILIANRGEIAVRIIRAAQKSGILTVAVFAADDSESLHVSLADESFLLSGKTLEENYLNQQKIIQIALKSGAEAIHPGYGFLSENAGFAEKVTQSGLVFIGPSPENIRLMGEKTRALSFVKSLDINTLISFKGTTTELLRHTSEMEFPVIVKASAGGGGKGMVICTSRDELLPALEKAERQAISYFGNGELFVEKYIPRARHIEVQLLADHHGKVLHFYERECTIQRQFQKIIEEAPSTSISENLRNQLTSSAVRIAKSMNYRNAGTIEFLLNENGQFYFLEMNTRIQVEHPVTEMITGLDLVSMQFMVAAGEHLQIEQEDIKVTGHAIEARLCAEDAVQKFKPSAGTIDILQMPTIEHTRMETFIKKGITISSNYDSLLAKLVVWDKDRPSAIFRMQQLMSKITISGIHTNLSFLTGLLKSDAIQKNTIYTRYLDENLDNINQEINQEREQQNKQLFVIAFLIFHFLKKNHTGNSIWNQIGFWRMNPQLEVSIEGKVHKCLIEFTPPGHIFRFCDKECLVSGWQFTGFQLEIQIKNQINTFRCMEGNGLTLIENNGFQFELQSNSLQNQAKVIRENKETLKIFQNLICADLFGKVLKLNVHAGDIVDSGQILLTLESMKTEIHVLCPAKARIKGIHVNVGDSVTEKQLLVELEEIGSLAQ